MRGEAVDVLFERVVGMERLVGVKQSLRLDGKKVCNIEMVGILQAESNNIKACALPSIHLPLTREASVMAQSKGWCGFGKGGAERGVAVQSLRLDGKKFAT